ncbi:hypothetical protein UA08_01501 [Talaromyces atroroseus]|uniref:PH domain-containing protein n=1 Tax=Talaromyces atroroseus TaxID=1441469 RepID=A0A1Q5QAF6_TALAT|nr:hypothetical protein UA08_01501 [Talaromyces atroroseus]OKL62927.1 hypothetical protein UA08_01501 [Talaromyces atroroseus]
MSNPSDARPFTNDTIIQDESALFQGLDPASYTAQRLRHASSHHLYLTSRRHFIGPIPEDWIHGHHLTFSAKTTSFNEAPQASFLNHDTSSTNVHHVSGVNDVDDGLPDNATQGYEVPNQDHNVENNEDAMTETGATARSNVNTGRTSSAFVTAREVNSAENIFATSADPTSSDGQAYDSGWVDTDHSQQQSSLAPSALPSTIGAGSTTSLLQNQHEINTQSDASVNTLQPQEPQPHTAQEGRAGSGPQDRVRERIARLNFDDNVLNQQQRIRSRIERTQDKVSANRPRWSKEREGEMVRAQKMLVRVEETSQTLPSDYSENVSLRTETRELTKWREYIVVCRKSIDEDALFTLKMYKTRVIQDVDRSRESAYYEVPLNRKSTKANLYSSLDKTWALWHPQKHGPHHDDQNLPRGSKEKLAASAVIENCIKVLKGRSEWAQALEKWSKTSKMGLAWRRFDRLEWIHGSHEDEMYGTIAMQNSHDLELRSKHHYPSTIKSSDGEEEEEPAPIEGFLIRLTSQRGVQQRLGKTFSKRQYYFSQDRFLCFCKPSKAVPPHPPDRDIVETSIPSYQEIAKRNPLQYDIHPYQIQDGRITWLSSGNTEFLRRHDEEAFAQFGRNIANLKNSEGLIDLCQVNKVQPSGDSGSVQVFAEGQNTIDAGRGEGNRFELVLVSGLVVRFKAYNIETRNEWVKRLTALVNYWKNRVIADAGELKAIRQRNLEILGIDERMESIFGQFASKWEISGYLYRKPRRHSTFHRCQVICTSGQLLVFQDVLRKLNGVEIPHIHKERVATLDLQNCYIYSGLITEKDLLYTNQTFDNNYPGHHALPRIYLAQDGWTSRDEDTAVCFVIWHPIRKSLFRASEVKGNKTNRILRRVSALGVPGRTVVFKARSRLERDRWVACIESEINRLQDQQGEDVRIV